MQNNSGNVPPMLLSEHFGEQLNQRMWGKGCSRRLQAPHFVTLLAPRLYFLSENLFEI